MNSSILNPNASRLARLEKQIGLLKQARQREQHRLKQQINRIQRRRAFALGQRILAAAKPGDATYLWLEKFLEQQDLTEREREEFADFLGKSASGTSSVFHPSSSKLRGHKIAKTGCQGANHGAV